MKLVLLLQNVRTIGYGNFRRGLRIIADIAQRLTHARTKHPWPAHCPDSVTATVVVRMEAREAELAARHEGRERTHDELLDVIAPAIRGINEEWR